MNFYEVNLPDSGELTHLSGNLLSAYEKARNAITERTERLNKALDISRMEPNKFHSTVSGLFNKTNPNHFDSLSAEQLAQYARLMDDGAPVEHRLEWDNAVVLFDTAFATTEEWKSIRHIGIGGSDAATVAGVNPYSSMRKLFFDKTGRIDCSAVDIDKKAIFDRGHILEPKVISTFCAKSGAVRIPESRMFRSKEYPHATANIDALVRMPDGDIYILEAKTAPEISRQKWTGDKVPRNYLCQCRQYPAVLDDDRIKGVFISCLFVVDYIVGGMFVDATFDGEQIVTRKVLRNSADEANLLEEEEYFWEEYISANVEPDAGDNGEVDLEISTALAGKADKELAPVELNARILTAIENYNSLDTDRKLYEAKAKDIKAMQDGYKAEIIAELGAATEGHLSLPNEDAYYEVKFSPCKKSAVCDIGSLALAFPDAYAACVTEAGEGSRRFSLKKRIRK